MILSSSAGPAAARDNRPADNGVRCVYYNPQTGEMEFYIPPAVIFVKDGNGKEHMLNCGLDGEWWDGGVMERPIKPINGR